MWPSENTVSRLYNIANWGVLAGLMLGVFFTFLVIWAGKKKGEYLERDLAAANKRVAIAESNAAEANKSAAKANEGAAKARESAERDRLARMKLEAQIQPRQYTAAQQDAIVKACAPFPGKLVVIQSLPYDVEGAVFARSIAELLEKRTRLEVNTTDIGNNFIQTLPMFTGVVVRGPESDQALVQALAHALATTRVVVIPEEMPTRPGSHTEILVGAKPLGPISSR